VGKLANRLKFYCINEFANSTNCLFRYNNSLSIQGRFRNDGKTILILAAQKGHNAVVAMLLDSERVDIDVNVADSRGELRCIIR
jgi:ankyrin repeat protein